MDFAIEVALLSERILSKKGRYIKAYKREDN